jgi:hypothetical protein
LSYLAAQIASLPATRGAVGGMWLVTVRKQDRQYTPFHKIMGQVIF